MDMPTELVALYRCKHCSVRMFESHLQRHLTQQHAELVSAQPVIIFHFVKGAKNVPARPGEIAMVYGRTPRQRAAPVIQIPTEDVPEPIEAVSLTSLEAIMDS